MPRPVTVYIDEARYSRLEQISAEQNVSVQDLLERRGVDMLIGDLDADLPRKAAAVIEAIDWSDLGKITAIITTLQALKGALPPRSP